MSVIASYAPYSTARPTGSPRPEIGRPAARQPAAAADGLPPRAVDAVPGHLRRQPIGQIALARHDPRQRPQPSEAKPGRAPEADAGRGRPQDNPPRVTILGLPGLAGAAFLAQQAAEAEVDPAAAEGRRRHAAAASAYRSVAERGRTILGPMLSVRLSV